MLREKVKQLESELGIVKWYITIMEDGIDSKQVVKEANFCNVLKFSIKDIPCGSSMMENPVIHQEIPATSSRIFYQKVF